MILILQKNTPEPAIRQLLAQLSLQNVKGGCVAGDNAILLPLVGETWRLDPSALQALPFVMEARRLTPAYRLAGRAAHPENTVVTVGDVSIGADFCLIAGPCAVESAYQMDTLSRAVKDAGAQLLRGGVFKPRTSPYTFQGMGEPGVDLLVQAGRSAGLPTVTEISDASQMELLADVDVWQVGARHPAACRYTGQRRQQGRGNGFALVAGQLHQNIRGNILPPHGGVRAVRRKIPQLPAGRCRGACFTLDQEIPPVRRPLQTDDGGDPLIQRLPRSLLTGATPAVWAAGILYIQRCI